MDAKLRIAKRADDGTPAARARVLCERLRAGEECICGAWRWECLCSLSLGDTWKCPRHVSSCGCAGTSLRERIELAAYCGDEAARAVAPPPQCKPVWGGCRLPKGHIGQHGWDPERKLNEWISGLQRWGQPVLLRAALAAGEVAIRTCERCGGVGLVDRPRNWPAPCHRCFHARKALDAVRIFLADPTEENYVAWANAWNALGDAKGWIPAPGRGDRSAINVQSLVRECARIAPVRETIQHALIEWALA